jgi:prepilin-type N-terminal cleavage/methylation domain-containing protein
MSTSIRTDQRGFTLVEVMVAALVLVIAFTALAAVFIGGQNESSSTVEEAQLINVADQQIEQVRAATANAGFGNLALTATPTAPSAPTSVGQTWSTPNSFVEGSSASGCGTTGFDFEIANNYDSVTTSGSGPYGATPTNFVPWASCSQGEPLEVVSSGLINVQNNNTPPTGTPTSCSSATIYSPCQVLVGNTTLDVYTYVTDSYVGCATGTSSSAACPTINSTGSVKTSSCTFPSSVTSSTPCADARRVTVAVVPMLSHTLARLTPVYVSTVFTNPTPSSSQQSAVGLTLGVEL